jgi:hypothetical protein
MAKLYRDNYETKTEPHDYVAVVLTSNRKQAKEYEAALKTNDIPAIIQDQDESTEGDPGFAVMVPKDYQEEAQLVIESQAFEENIYDPLWDDEIDDFDDEFPDDDF